MQPDHTAAPPALAFDPKTADTAAIAERLTAGVAGRSAYERAATMLLTRGCRGDLLDLDGVRATIHAGISTAAWRVRWYELAQAKDALPVSTAGAALIDLACALAAGPQLADWGAGLAKMDVANRRLAADAFALAAGVYAAPPDVPAGGAYTAVDVAWWVQRFLGQHAATVMHGDMGMAGEEPTLEVTLPDGRGRFLITFEDGDDARASCWAGGTPGDTPPAGGRRFTGPGYLATTGYSRTDAGAGAARASEPGA